MRYALYLLMAITGSLINLPGGVLANDSQHWNDTSILIKSDDSFSLEIFNRLRFRDIPFAKPFQNCYQGGLKYRVLPRLSILAAYRYDIADKDDYSEYDDFWLSRS